jgi:hypothetical protein
MRSLNPAGISDRPKPGDASETSAGFLTDFRHNHTIIPIMLIVEWLDFILALSQSPFSGVITSPLRDCTKTPLLRAGEGQG